MAGPKTLLSRGDRYGLLKATELAAEMITEFERGRDGAIEMRVESIGDAVWDDVRLVHATRIENWQVKRLMVDVADKDITPLIRNAAEPRAGPDRHLRFAVAKFVAIKSGKTTLCELKDLAELCDESRKPGLAAIDFARTIQKRLTAAYTYVSNCIQPADASAILATLQRLRVDELGTEPRLRVQAAAHLGAVFRNADELVKQLHAWLVQHNDGAISVTIPLLYEQVINPYGDRDPAVPRWMHLTRNPVTWQWEVRGPLLLANLVSGMWDGNEQVRLQLSSPPLENDPATAALSRLLLHQSGRTVAEVNDGAAWGEQCASLCAGTLGAAVERPSLRWKALSSAPVHPPQEEAAPRDLASKLGDEMNARMWRDYGLSVTGRLHADRIGQDLRTAMQLMWRSWHDALDSSPTRCAKFLHSMLATAEEWKRAGFDPDVRSGSHLVDHLARATIAALAVAATFATAGISTTVGADSPDSVDNLHFPSVTAHAIALRAASHPEHRKPWALLDAPGALLESEAGIAILGMVEASAIDLFAIACSENMPYHASDTSSETYRHTGKPFPILTAGPPFRAAMGAGLSAMKIHLGTELALMNDVRVDGLRSAVAKGGANG